MMGWEHHHRPRDASARLVQVRVHQTGRRRQSPRTPTPPVAQSELRSKTTFNQSLGGGRA
jgi:hypothetical protein